MKKKNQSLVYKWDEDQNMHDKHIHTKIILRPNLIQIMFPVI